MSEVWIGTVPLFGLVLVAIGCWFYQAGGRDEFPKGVRRYGGSFVLSSAVWLEFILMGIWSWWLLAIYPLCIFHFALGYGSGVYARKLYKRSYVVAASLLSSILICVVYGGMMWYVLPIEVIIASITIYIGVKNPTYAAAEEYFVCAFFWLPKLMYPFVDIIAYVG